MRKMISLYLLAGLIFSSQFSGAQNKRERLKNEKDFTCYLMAYFNPEEKLYYAYSYDAKNWVALNNGKPVFDSGVRLRDPFLNRVNGKFHMVHTKGWDHPTIFHWESDDLIDWTGGAINVVDSTKKRAWAPEFFYAEKEKLFYVFWASLHEQHNVMHYVTTKNWEDISPDKSKVYYDLGIHNIDLTIVENEGTYYAFHKPGSVEDKMGNRMFTSKSLKPGIHTFGKEGNGKVVFENENKPTEGPEVIKLLGEKKWYIYCDPFKHPLEAWETNDFKTFSKIEVNTPKDAKHCSFIHLTKKELQGLKKKYPNTD